MEPKNKTRQQLKNDNVSVVHSGEIEPAPNQEAQEAYAEDTREPVTNAPARTEPEDKRDDAQENVA